MRRTVCLMAAPRRGVGLLILLLLGGPLISQAFAQADPYDTHLFGGSSYAQHGPGPAYNAGYSNYGANATGIEGRFSPNYPEYGAIAGYGRYGAGSSYGTGPLREAGTGRGGQIGPTNTNQRRSRSESEAGTSGKWKYHPRTPF